MTEEKQIPTSRRRFFRSFLAEAIGFVEQMKGIKQFHLNEIADLSDEIIRQMKPVKTGIPQIWIEEDRLVRCPSKSAPVVTLRTFDKQELFIINQFNGEKTLEEIARQTASQFALDTDMIYPKTKALFIQLSQWVFCYPAAPPAGVQDTQD